MSSKQFFYSTRSGGVENELSVVHVLSAEGTRKDIMTDDQQSTPIVAAHPIRYVFMALVCFNLTGMYYAYDLPTALNSNLKTHLKNDTGLSEKQWLEYYGMMYSLTSMPNVLLPLCFGLAVDSAGPRMMVLFVNGCCVLGQAMFYFGVCHKVWWQIFLGRFFLGLSTDNMIMVKSILLYRWFKGREYAFALGVNISVSRLATVAVDVIAPDLALRHGLSVAVLSGLLLCGACALCSILIVVMDKYLGDRVGMREVCSEEDRKPLSVAKLQQLSRSFWLVSLLFCIMYAVIDCFSNVGTQFLIEEHFADLPVDAAQVQAGRALAVLFLTSACLAPPLGLLIDEIGYRTHFLILGMVVCFVTYLRIFTESPTVSMVSLGFVYSCFASVLWACIALVVPPNILGVASGIVTCMENLSLCLVPIFLAGLEAAETGVKHFASVMRFFQALSLLGIVVSVLVHWVNHVDGGVLDLTSADAELVRHSFEDRALTSSAAASSSAGATA